MSGVKISWFYNKIRKLRITEPHRVFKKNVSTPPFYVLPGHSLKFILRFLLNCSHSWWKRLPKQEYLHETLTITARGWGSHIISWMRMLYVHGCVLIGDSTMGGATSTLFVFSFSYVHLFSTKNLSKCYAFFAFEIFVENW